MVKNKLLSFFFSLERYKIILLISVILVSCNNEISTELAKPVASNEDISVVSILDGKVDTLNTRALCRDNRALCFKDTATFKNFINKLQDMSADERLKTVRNFGIVTLRDLAERADDELEEIGRSSLSEDDFRLRYQLYKKKYEGFLVANDADSTDLTLYVPNEDDMCSYIVNERNQFVVGGEVVTNTDSSPLKTISSMSTMGSNIILENTDEYSPKDGKMVYFKAYMLGERMWVKMYCKKQMWYGWKNDPHRSYYFESHMSSNFTYLKRGVAGQPVACMPEPRYVFNQNVKNGFEIILGQFNSGSAITGYIDTWTDMTSEFDENGNELLEQINGMWYPKCLKSKARTISIYLNFQSYIY